MAERRDFALYPVTRTSIALLTGRVDGYTGEEHRIGLDKTRYPVETGSTLTDNAVSLPERLRLEGWVSDILPAPGNTLSRDRATDAWVAILDLAKTRQPFDVVTPIRVYRNMMIVRAEAPRNVRTGQSLRFTIELEELLFGQTELSTISPDQVSGPAADRTSTVDGGTRASPAVEPPRIVSFQSAPIGTTLEPSGLSPSGIQTAGLPSPRAFNLAPLPDAVTGRIPMAQQIPLTGDASQSFRTLLGGQTVRVLNRWQPLDQSWYTSLSDLNREPIISGARLVEDGLPLAGRVSDAFKGELFVDGQGEPGRGAWGTTHRLLYLAGDVL